MFKKIIASVLLCIALISCTSCFGGWLITPETDTQQPVDSMDTLSVLFIDVGQADSVLITCGGQHLLIDGGNVGDSSTVYTVLKNNNITTLDYVICTHAHEDHVGGLSGALEFAKVGTVYCPVTSNSTKAFTNFADRVKKQGKEITVPETGTTFNVGDAVCTLFCPTPSDNGNDSIVMRLVHGNNSFLFTGDCENEEEKQILDSGFAVESAVLKVGHHGSDTSTGYLWLRTVNPQYAVICVGTDNKYGHPTEATLSKLRDAEVKTFRTDMQGDITCVSDGNTLTWTVARNANADTLSGAGIGQKSTEAATQYAGTPTEAVTEAQTHTSETVYVSATGTKYHSDPTCSGMKNATAVSKEEAVGRGLTPCSKCN